MGKKIRFALFAFVAVLALSAPGITPPGAQKVSALDEAVRSVSVALLAGKPKSAVGDLMMTEGDIDGLFRVMLAEPSSGFSPGRDVHDPVRREKLRARMKKDIAVTNKRWNETRAALKSGAAGVRYLRMRGFQVQSDCGARFYQVKLVFQSTRGSVKRKIKVPGMFLVYFSGRFKVVRLFKLKMPSPAKPRPGDTRASLKTGKPANEVRI